MGGRGNGRREALSGHGQSAEAWGIQGQSAEALRQLGNLWAGVPQKFWSKPKPNATRGQIREGVKNKNAGGVG